MGDGYAWLIFVICMIVIMFVLTVINRKRNTEELKQRLAENYGKPFNGEYGPEHLLRLHEMLEDEEYDISDEIWKDLLMDDVFGMLDQSVSAVGEEYLYLTLHRYAAPEVLADRRACANEWKKYDKRLDVMMALSAMGKQKRYTFHGFIKRLFGAKEGNNAFHIASLLAFIASVVFVFVNANVGIPLLLVIACVNSLTYFSAKSKIAPYIDTLSAAIKWLRVSSGLKKTGMEHIDARIDEIREKAAVFNRMKKGAWLFAPQSAVGSIIDTVFDYLKFITHIDIIEFNILIAFLKKYRDDLKSLYNLTGEFELGIVISGIREFETLQCIPELKKSDELFIEAKDSIHPLVSCPVANDICMKNNWLITGSNASGKSTFLKMVCLNMLLSQSIDTAFAGEFKASFMEIGTSFDISDDILKGDSYYISEIKRLKGILEASEDGCGMLVGIDEILKGTNTKERVAASCEVLRYLAGKKVLVIAATHDTELVDMLEGVYEDYYFTENPDSEENLFDYKLRKGRNYTGNAIKLLKLYGFPEEIITGSLSHLNAGDDII